MMKEFSFFFELGSSNRKDACRDMPICPPRFGRTQSWNMKSLSLSRFVSCSLSLSLSLSTDFSLLLFQSHVLTCPRVPSLRSCSCCLYTQFHKPKIYNGPQDFLNCMHVYVLLSYLRTTWSSDNRVAVNQRKQIKYRLLRVCETQQTTLEVNEVLTLICFHMQTRKRKSLHTDRLGFDVDITMHIYTRARVFKCLHTSGHECTDSVQVYACCDCL
jgi:hypothetical protein